MVPISFEYWKNAREIITFLGTTPSKMDLKFTLEFRKKLDPSRA